MLRAVPENCGCTAAAVTSADPEPCHAPSRDSGWDGSRVAQSRVAQAAGSMWASRSQSSCTVVPAPAPAAGPAAAGCAAAPSAATSSAPEGQHIDTYLPSFRHRGAAGVMAASFLQDHAGRALHIAAVNTETDPSQTS